MFLKDIEEFKITVEKSIDSFFGFTPQQMKENILVIEKLYGQMYDLEKISFKSIRPDLKEVLMRYRTLKYFNSVYDKTMELYDFLKKGEKDDC